MAARLAPRDPEINEDHLAAKARETVVRLNDSRLVIFSAIALDEGEMARLEAYGRPAFLIVPSDKHRLDAKIWKDRYLAMQVVAPEGARAKIEKVVRVDTFAPDFEDSNVQFVTVPGTRAKEAALVARTPNGTTLVLNDLVGNIRNEAGVGGWLLRMAGFAGKQAQIPRVVKMALIKDPTALRAQLLQWAEIESLKRILVSHSARSMPERISWWFFATGPHLSLTMPARVRTSVLWKAIQRTRQTDLAGIDSEPSQTCSVDRDRSCHALERELNMVQLWTSLGRVSRLPGAATIERSVDEWLDSLSQWLHSVPTSPDLIQRAAKRVFEKRLARLQLKAAAALMSPRRSGS